MNQEKSNEKTRKIQEFAASLSVELRAGQVVTKSGLIENVVLFLDREEYPKETATPVDEAKKE